MALDINPAFLWASVGCAWITLILQGRRLAHLDKLVRERLWAAHVMTWAEYVALPLELHGCPHYEIGGSGPDRRVVVFIRVMAGLPDPVDPEGHAIRARMERGDA